MPSWQDFQPFIVSGLALGGVYALSGVGLIVLYRATGVLNLAFGAIGAMGALIAWSLIQAGVPGWISWLACVAFGGAVTLGYGIIFGPALAKRDPLVKAVKDFNTGMLCQLWTYGNYPTHIPNNADYTVTPDNGKMVTAQGCTLISSVDPQIAQYRSVAGTAPMAP